MDVLTDFFRKAIMFTKKGRAAHHASVVVAIDPGLKACFAKHVAALGLDGWLGEFVFVFVS